MSQVSAQLPDGRMVTVHSQGNRGAAPSQSAAGGANPQPGQTKPKAKSFTEQAWDANKAWHSVTKSLCISIPGLEETDNLNQGLAQLQTLHAL